jgi:hypothetical protein
LKNVWKEIQFKRSLRQKMEKSEKIRQHDRKEEPKRAPVVPNRRGP